MIDIKYVFTTVVVVQMWAYGCCLTGHNKIKHANLSHNATWATYDVGFERHVFKRNQKFG